MTHVAKVAKAQARTAALIDWANSPQIKNGPVGGGALAAGLAAVSAEAEEGRRATLAALREQMAESFGLITETLEKRLAGIDGTALLKSAAGATLSANLGALEAVAEAVQLRRSVARTGTPSEFIKAVLGDE